MRLIIRDKELRDALVSAVELDDILSSDGELLVFNETGGRIALGLLVNSGAIAGKDYKATR